MKTQEEIEKILSRPLPTEAIKPPNSKGLSSIKPIFVTDRLNEAFGVGCWSEHVTDMGAVAWQQQTKSGEREMYTAKVHVRITLPNGTQLECVATSQNDDEGDASKGAISDCISKIGSWLGIGAHIWRGHSLERAWADWNTKYIPPAERARNYINANTQGERRKDWMDLLDACKTDEEIVNLAKDLAKALAQPAQQ